MENFKECLTVEQANEVDLKYYTFIKLDERRGYCFKIREAKK